MTASNVVALEQPQTDSDSWAWVEPWLRSRGGGLTTVAYMQAWSRFLRFFAEFGITLETLNRGHCFQFVTWFGVKRNTAKTKLRVLSLVCNEAIARGLITKNPAANLCIRKDPPREKPEITPELEREILSVIENKKHFKHREFYRVSFMIAMKHGVRLAETRLLLSNVRLDTDPPMIVFHMKGNKVHGVPLHPELVPMFQVMKERGQTWTFEYPSNPNHLSAYWQKFLNKNGFIKRFPNLCFHCCRVTCITRLARANVSQAKAMRYVAHASEAVHAIYQKIGVADLADCHTALKGVL